MSKLVFLHRRDAETQSRAGISVPLRLCGSILVAGLLLLITAPVPALAAGPQTPSRSTTIEGKLVTGGACPVLEANGKKYPLAADQSYVQNTLADARLNGREIRVEGTLKPDGGLSVEKFYTVKDGKLYRVRYYCYTCHIAYLEPGICYCCQKPTDLQEIPITQADADTLAD